MSCFTIILNKKTNNVELIKNTEKINKKTSFNFNTNENNESNESNYTTFFNKLQELLSKLNSNLSETLKKSWSNLTEEEKLLFEVVEPETFRLETKEGDLDKYDSQERVEPINNFSIVLLFPYLIEHSIFPKPQVIANSRKPHFESLYKPRKVNKKYLLWSKPP